MTNPRPQAARPKAVARPGPIEGLVMMALGVVVLSFAFMSQIDGYGPADLALRLLPGSPAMAESDAGSIGL